MRRHHRGHCGPDLSSATLGKEHVFNAGETAVGCRPKDSVCGPGRPGAETLDPPWRRVQLHLSDCRAFQVHIQVRLRHSANLAAAAPIILATHKRNLDKYYRGI
jgi:hypothetical protein